MEVILSWEDAREYRGLAFEMPYPFGIEGDRELRSRHAAIKTKSKARLAVTGSQPVISCSR